MTKSSGMILDSFSWPTKWVSIREDTNKPGKVHTRLRHQRRQSYDEVRHLTYKSLRAVMLEQQIAIA
jgi:hypothetical protein